MNVADMLQRAEQPYRAQQELVADELAATTLRLCAVRDACGRDPSWPSELLAGEALIRGRIRTSDPAVLPIAVLRARFELSVEDMRLLWVLIAHELCPIARALVREINTEQVSEPTTDTLRRVIYGARGRTVLLSDDCRLRRLGLVVATDASTAVYRQTWAAAPRVLDLLDGELALDRGSKRFAAIVLPPRLADLAVDGDAVSALGFASSRDGIVVAYGRAGTGRRSVLAAIAADRGQRVLDIDARALSRDRESARRELRELARECVLLDLVPLVRDLDALAGTPEACDRIELVEDELGDRVLATASRRIARRWRQPATQIELPPLPRSELAVLWQRALPAASAAHAHTLASLYPLAPALVHEASALAGDVHHIAAGLRSLLDDRVAGLASRVTTTQTWDDLVLPADQQTALVELIARIRERPRVYEDWGFGAKVGRALGVSALLSGPPGTGKTMAAALVAREVGVELYQVDLSKIVSKWVGETEKNLAALFDAAEAGHAMLLFDEADALFCKRTEVRSSNDRFANQEVNFLLSRMESFAGIVILTTNHESAIDEAFRRRLSVHVRFPIPEQEERLRLWTACLPRLAPTSGDLRLRELAESFEMTGGYIRNAVLRAAFLAAAEQTPIVANHLLRAAELEYEALGKIAAHA